MILIEITNGLSKNNTTLAEPSLETIQMGREGNSQVIYDADRVWRTKNWNCG